MQRSSALLILEAARDRSETTPGALRRIAAAAAEAMPHGPISLRISFDAPGMTYGLVIRIRWKPPIGAGPVGTQRACWYVDSIIR